MAAHHVDLRDRWPWPHVGTALMAAVFATPARAEPLVYVANLGSANVSVIDAGSNAVIATIPVGSDPDGIAATPNGRTVFVTNFVSEDVNRIDTATNTVVGTIPVGSGPVGIAVSPDGALAYVANKLSDTLSVVRTDTDTGTPVVTLPTGPGPNGVAVRPDGAVVYVTNSRSRSPGTVTVVDARANTVIGAIPVQHSPGRVAFSPDGRRAYVTNFNSWTVSVIDTEASAVVDTLSTWGRPAHIAVNPNGAFVYVSGLGGRVQVIDTRTHDTTGLIGVEASPYSFALLPTGAAGFATGFHAGTVSVVDVVAEAEVAVVPVGTRPFAAVVVCPGGCTDVPFTPPPTRTPTETPVAPPTRTPPPSATPIPTHTPVLTHTPGPTPHVGLIATAQAVHNGRVTIDVLLDTGGEPIAGTQNEFVFDRFALRLPSREACVINPAIGQTAPECEADGGSAPCKVLSTVGQWACYHSVSPEGCPDPDPDPRGVVRLLLFAFANTRPIPDGLLYSCTFDILDAARLPTAVVVTGAIVSDPSGRRIPLATSNAVVEAEGAGVSSKTVVPSSFAVIEPSASRDIVVPLDGARPVHVASGTAGEIWFTDSGTDRVGRLGPTGTMTLFRLPALSGPAGLAVDPTGAVWVALNDRNRIARIDPATGAVDDVVLPRAAQPFGIAIGPDGNMWFTEIGANAIGRLMSDGRLTQFPLPTRLAAPMGIVAAADGHLWFAEHNANRIGRISVDGAITEYPLPSPGGAPLGVAATADGSVWFTELRGGRLGRITPDGIVTELALPGPGSRPVGVAAGADGSVWVTDIGTQQILRRAPDGAIEIVAAAPGFEDGTLFGAGVAVTDEGDSAIYAATAQGRLVRAAVTAGDATPTTATTVTPSASPTPSSLPGATTPTRSPTETSTQDGAPTPTPPGVASPAPTRMKPSPGKAHAATRRADGGCQTTSRSRPSAWFLLLPPAVLCLHRLARRPRVRSGGSCVLAAAVCASGALLTVAALAKAQDPVQINLGTARGAPGDLVHLVVSLAAGEAAVVATVNDFTLPAGALSLDPELCRVNPAIRKTLRASVLRAETAATFVRVVVQAATDATPIPDGVLYTCPVRIAPSALPATFRVANALTIAVDPTGANLPDVDGSDGGVTVSLIGRVCAGDCNDDGTVTVDELLVGATMALGMDDLLRCVSFDADGSGLVTIDELLLGVGNAQGGCVAPPTPPPTPTPTPTPVPQTIYVRTTGDDTNTGASAPDAVRTISHAARLVQRGGRVVVGPGTYRDGVTTDGSGRPARQVTFLADPSGAATGDAPGPVVVDAAGSAVGAGFRFSNAPGVVIDGFEITGAVDAGVVLKSGGDDAVVRHCVVHGNAGAGIRVQDSARVVVFNNLVHDNAAEGVAIVGQAAGSPDVWIVSNTIARNGNRGLTIGTSRAASPGAVVRNNIVQDNGGGADKQLENVKVFTTPPSEVGYAGDFNLVRPPTYLPADIAGANDVGTDAGFEFPGGGDFRLRPDSPAIDAGDVLPRDLATELGARSVAGTTRDTGRLDLGYHLPLP